MKPLSRMVLKSVAGHESGAQEIDFTVMRINEVLRLKKNLNAYVRYWKLKPTSSGGQK